MFSSVPSILMVISWSASYPNAMVSCLLLVEMILNPILLDGFIVIYKDREEQ